MMRKALLFVMGILLVGCSPKYFKSRSGRPVVNHRVENRARHSQVKKPQRQQPIVRRPPTERNPELLVATSAVTVTPAVIREYVQQYKDIAIVEMQRYKIPASITLAQAILESGSGQGRLARYAHNHFGIKCHSTWEGPSIYHDDDENDECFRKYEHPEQSFEDHSLFLVNRSRYASLFELDPGDYKGWAYGLKQAGYATDPKYPSKLIFLINKYELHHYDLIAMGLEAKVDMKRLPENMYLVQPGDTLYSISRKMNVTVEELMSLNNLSDANIKVGQALKIHR